VKSSSDIGTAKSLKHPSFIIMIWAIPLGRAMRHSTFVSVLHLGQRSKLRTAPIVAWLLSLSRRGRTGF